MNSTLLRFNMALIILGAPVPILAAEPIRLTMYTGADRHPDWSPDGSYLVFESYRSGDWHIYRINADGTGEQQLTFDAQDQMHPEISPDGTRLAYVQGNASSNGSTSSTSIRILDLLGVEPTLTVVPSTGQSHWHPTWSQDGQFIYFDRANSSWDIYRVPAGGGTAQLVVDIGVDAFLSVSPDNASVAYMVGVGGGAYNVRLAPLASPMLTTQLTFEQANTVPDDFSPDGTRMVCSSRKIGGRMELFELDIQGGGLTRLTFDAESSAFDPVSRLADYSPDGSQVAFSSYRMTGDENIWILPLAGSPPLANVLSVGGGAGLPGAGPVTLPVTLRSSQSSPALEFRLADMPDWLEVVDVRTTGRAGALTVSFVDEGDAHVLLYSTGLASLPPGIGKILDIDFLIHRAATEGDSVQLALTDLVFSDPDGEPLALAAEDGVFHVRRLPGDVTGDNLVDVGDLVRLVEIILGTGATASPEELAAADCNGDAAHNALDVPCLLGHIFELGAAPSVLAGAGEPLPENFVLAIEEDVRGIQFTLPGSGGLPSAAEVEPFQLTTGLAQGRPTALAFDPKGNGWSAGMTIPFRSGAAGELRAYGPGGRRLEVVSTPQGYRIGAPLPRGLVVGAPGRNPFRSTTDIRFSIDRPAEVRVSIYDIRGARVAVLPARPVEAGRHAWPWNARDDRGRYVPAGVYVALVEGAGQRGAVRLTHLGR